MKQISPIQSWINGKSVTATIFNMYVIGGVLGSSASFYYSLLDSDLANVAQGNLTMSGDAYLADCDAAASLAAASAHIQTGSTLPATASFSGTLNLDGDIAAGGAVTMGAAGIVNANVSQAAARFTSLTARNIVFAAGGVVFSQAVIVG